MNRIYQKVTPMMDELQEMMETQVHLTDPIKVCELIDKISLYWAHLLDEDTEYLQCALSAVEDETEWKL
jgi:hypothetical protein